MVGLDIVQWISLSIRGEVANYQLNKIVRFWNAEWYLQQATLTELHREHMGVVKTKGLARIYVWWPEINGDP